MILELNADIGEGCLDAPLMPYLDRASIACGGHAGDAASMAAALDLCREYSVVPGAHPAYPDRANFGRHPLAATPEQICRWVIEQTEPLLELAARRGQLLAHVKPHGALYNIAARDSEVAEAIARAVVTLDRSLILIGLAHSILLDAGRAAGLPVMAEAFADRGYRADGSLVPRGTPGDLLDASAAAAQARTIQAGQPLVAGRVVRADTLCLHSDTPDADTIARAVAAALRG
jgi:UPF0271 protein